MKLTQESMAEIDSDKRLDPVRDICEKLISEFDDVLVDISSFGCSVSVARPESKVVSLSRLARGEEFEILAGSMSDYEEIVNALNTKRPLGRHA